MPSVRSTVTVAPARLLSVNDAGTVAEIAAETSSTAVTVTEPVVAGPVPVASAVCRTVTLSDASMSKSGPTNASVSVACVALSRTTEAMLVPVGAPTSVKLPATGTAT